MIVDYLKIPPSLARPSCMYALLFFPFSFVSALGGAKTSKSPLHFSLSFSFHSAELRLLTALR